MPRSHPEGVAGASNDWTGAVIPFSSHAKMTNEIQICFSKWWENEKRNSNPFFKVMRKRKTKNEIHIRSWKCWKTKNESWNWYPFFKVMRKRKTKYEVQNRFLKLGRKRKTKSKIQICFSMSCENEKWKWHLNSLFPCHRKTVGTKVHAF